MTSLSRRPQLDRFLAALSNALGAVVCILAGQLAPTLALAAPGDAPAAENPAISAAQSARNKAKYRRSKLTYDESEGTADRRRLLLTTGEDRAIDLDFEVNGGKDGISTGNPTLVVPQLVRIGDKRQIVFKPLKSGETTVTLRDSDGTIRLVFMVRITGSNLLRVASEVRSLLRDVEGVEIRIVGPKVVVEGEVLVPSDYARLYSVISDKTYADFVLNLVTLSPIAMQALAKRIQDDINTFAPNVRTRVVNGMIFLEGQVDNAEQAGRSVRIASLYLPEIRPGNMLEKDPSAKGVTGRKLIENFLVINPPPPKKAEKLVRVTVHFVELSKDYNRLFGFKWQPGFTADPTITVGQNATGGAGATGASFSATLSSLLPRLQTAQTAGYARILKTGTVIVRSGQPANLAEQTQMPYAIQTGDGKVTSANASVGLEVAVTPLILGQSEDIQMDINMNQTNVVGRAPATGGAPVTASHKVVTKLYVRSNESAAVAGVTATAAGTDFNKDDPKSGGFDQGTDPLFTLMHSKNYQKKKSQFVIFVTPQIIENASEGTEDLKKNFRVKVK